MAQRTDAPDAGNKFSVVVRDDRIIVLRPPIAGQPLDVEDAANLSGWILALLEAIPGGHELGARMRKAIEQS